MIDFLVLIYFIFSSIYFTFPLAFHSTDRIIDIYDGLQLTWIINWVIHSLITNPLSLFQGNIFYPYKNTLAYSQLHFAEALLALPFVKIFKEPLVAYNLNQIAALFLSGFATYLLVKHLLKDRLVAFLCGNLFSYSIIHFNYLGYLDYFSFQYLIFSIYFYFLYLGKRKKFLFFLFLSFSLLTFLNSFYVGFFLILSILVISFFYKELKIFIFWVIVILFLSSPFYFPYFSVSRQFNYVRPIREVIHFSLQPGDLIYPSNISKISEPLIKILNLLPKDPKAKVTPAYLGLGYLFLITLSLFNFKKINFKKRELKIFLVIAFLSLILSFGPVLHLGRKTVHKPFIIPLPYVFLYYLIPGFKAFRVPSRLILLFAFSLAIALGIMFKMISTKWSKFKKLAFIVFCSFLIFWEFNWPLKFFEVPKRRDYPLVYYYLEKIDKKAPILELPILNWDAFELVSIETKRMLYSTLSFRPMVNGNSGFTPPERENLMKKIMLDFPNKELVRWLKEIKVKYLIIHEGDYKILKKNNFLIGGKKFKSLQELKKELGKFRKDFVFVEKINEDLIYKIK